jgi:hypothetical protein
MVHFGLLALAKLLIIQTGSPVILVQGLRAARHAIGAAVGSMLRQCERLRQPGAAWRSRR